MSIDGKPHPHSFWRDGTETRNVKVDVIEGKGIEIASKVLGMLLLKSTGAHFWGYIKDEFTTQKDTYDRMLSTEVDATWRWKHFQSLEDVKSDSARFDNAWNTVRDITMKIFAEDESPSVQSTMYKMAEQVLAAVPEVESVDYALPNKHYFEVGELSRSILSYWP
jgi:urate oxidase